MRPFLSAAYSSVAGFLIGGAAPVVLILVMFHVFSHDPLAAEFADIWAFSVAVPCAIVGAAGGFVAWAAKAYLNR